MLVRVWILINFNEHEYSIFDDRRKLNVIVNKREDFTSAWRNSTFLGIPKFSAVCVNVMPWERYFREHGRTRKCI